MAATSLCASTTKSTASFVDICSNTTLNFGNDLQIFTKYLSINTFSLSKISIDGSFTSPCKSSGIFFNSIFSKIGKQSSIDLIPFSEFVVTPEG